MARTQQTSLGILDAVDVEPRSEPIARAAGEAMAALPGATVVDAIVMASAAQRGDVVFTSDIQDLERAQHVSLRRDVLPRWTKIEPQLGRWKDKWRFLVEGWQARGLV